MEIFKLILDPEEYIHRVGRTARGAEGKGKALLILLKYEIGLVRYLRAAKVFKYSLKQI